MSLIHDCIELSRSDILWTGADICNCKSSANEWCMIQCEYICIYTYVCHRRYVRNCSAKSCKNVEEGDSVVEKIFVIIGIIKFADQDIIEFLSFFLYMRQPVEFFNVIYIYICMLILAWLIRMYIFEI